MDALTLSDGVDTPLIPIDTIPTPDEECSEEVVGILSDLHDRVLETIGQRDEEEIVWEIEESDESDDTRRGVIFPSFEESKSERIDVDHREEELPPVYGSDSSIRASTKEGS